MTLLFHLVSDCAYGLCSMDKVDYCNCCGWIAWAFIVLLYLCLEKCL